MKHQGGAALLGRTGLHACRELQGWELSMLRGVQTLPKRPGYELDWEALFQQSAISFQLSAINNINFCGGVERRALHLVAGGKRGSPAPGAEVALPLVRLISIK